MSNPLEEKIIKILESALGTIVAKSNLHVACRYAGIKEEEITGEDLPAIAENLEKLMVSMLGPSVVKSITEQVKKL